MKNILFIRYFGIFSVIAGILYFIIETWVTIKYGQSAIQLIADYMGVSLLIFGGLLILRNPEGTGIICGAWGYNFCINYRAFAWRMDRINEGTSDSITYNFAMILAVVMIFSLAAFIISMKLVYPKN